MALSDADSHPRRSARRHRAPVVWATHRPAPVALTPRRCLHPRAVGRTASITAHSRSQLRKRLAQRLLSWAKQNCYSKSETYITGFDPLRSKSECPLLRRSWPPTGHAPIQCRVCRAKNPRSALDGRCKEPPRASLVGRRGSDRPNTGRGQERAL